MHESTIHLKKHHVALYALAVALLMLVAETSVAQIRTSFAESQSSAVNYTKPTAGPGRSCKSLLEETDFDVSVVSAHTISATDKTPEHCQVFAVIRAEIRVWINLPKAWNGRLYVIGEGGYGGHDAGFWLWGPWQERGLQSNFVTVFNDTGHDERIYPHTTFAHNSLGGEIDFGFRAVHLSTVFAKRIVETYYGTQPNYSYFDGCSTGGRQGIAAAQRFPHDYDGILAGDPPFDMVGLMVRLRQSIEALHEIKITPSLLAILGDTIYKRCDKIDGLEDRVLRDPRQCDFSPQRDLPLCQEKASEECFTKEQIHGLDLLYGPVIVGGKTLQPGTPMGAEIKDLATGKSGWEPRLMNIDKDGNVQQPLMEERIADWLPNMAFEVDKAEITWRDFDLERDLPKLERTRMIHDATDPDLSLLAEANGKLIVYHGWSDTGPNPIYTAEYFDKIYEVMGDKARNYARLFMVPGMFHCLGGTNVDRFDGMTALINWVERGVAPDMIVAGRIENGATVRTRPMCAYPQVAKYMGKGSTDEAENFACVTP
jgi:feruloyl esterase